MTTTIKSTDPARTRELLLRIIAANEAVPDEKFDMGFWQSLRESGCGSVRCLIGHAMPVLEDTGLRMYRCSWGWRPELPGTPYREMSAVQQALHLERLWDAEYLFLEDTGLDAPMTRAAALDRLRQAVTDMDHAIQSLSHAGDLSPLPGLCPDSH